MGASNLDTCDAVEHRIFSVDLWQRARTRFRELRKRGVNAEDAILTARSNRGPWRVTLTAALCWALPGAYFASLGLPHLERP